MGFFRSLFLGFKDPYDMDPANLDPFKTDPFYPDPLNPMANSNIPGMPGNMGGINGTENHSSFGSSNGHFHEDDNGGYLDGLSQMQDDYGF